MQFNQENERCKNVHLPTHNGHAVKKCATFITCVNTCDLKGDGQEMAAMIFFTPLTLVVTVLLKYLDPAI